VTRHQYFRGHGGVNTFGWTEGPGIKTKGSRISY
jgi:hypothetical protein